MKRIVFVCVLLSALLCYAARKLHSATDNPWNNLFVKGSPVRITFRAEGLAPNEKTILHTEIRDHLDRVVLKKDLPLTAGPDGGGKAVLEAPGDRFGYFRVTAALPDGTTLPKLGSRPRGCLTYGVLPDPKKRKLYPLEQSFLGIFANGGGRADLIPWIGARVESSIMWRTPEEYAQYKKSAAQDRIPFPYYTYDTMAAFNLPAKQLTKEQMDAHTRGTRGYNLVPIDEEGDRLFQEAYRKVASRASWQMGINKNMRYQILWEPELNMSDEDMIRIQKNAYRAIHAADPTAILMGPCFSTLTRHNNMRFDVLCSKGYLDFVDEVSIHPYLDYPVEQNGALERISELKETIRKYGKGRKLRIRGTESGFKALTPEQERVQMFGALRYNLILLGEGFASNVQFHAMDYGDDLGNQANGDYGLCYNLTLDLSKPYTRYSTKNVSPKGTFAGLAMFSWILEGCTAVERIDGFGDGVLGYVYHRKNESYTVLALWDYNGKNTAVALPVGKETVEVADMMGNVRRTPAPGGLLKLTLSEAPQYVLNPSPDLWGPNAVKKISVEEETLKGTAGTLCTVRGKALEKGQVRLVFPPAFHLPDSVCHPAENGSFGIAFRLPENLKNGNYSLQFHLEKNNRTSAVLGKNFTIRSPLEIVSVSPSLRRGIPGILARLKNTSEKKISGAFKTRITGQPEARQTRRFTLLPFRETLLEIPFAGFEPDPFAVYALDLTIRPDSGRTVRKTTRVNFAFAVRLPEGNDPLRSWKVMKRFPVPDQALRGKQYHSGKNDLSASAAFGWNSRYLCLDILVNDDAFVQPYTGFNIWQGDSIQLGIASARQTQAANGLAASLELAYSELNFGISPGKTTVHRAVSFDPAHFPIAEVPETEIPRLFRRENGRIHYRIAIPWNQLNRRAAASGDAVYFALTVNDRDSADPKVQNVISAIGAFELKKNAPEFFGSLILE